MGTFNPIFSGRQRRSGSTRLPRHRHQDSYLALVLSGGYEEAGDRGRHRVHAGDVVVHGAFEAHLNRYESAGAEVLNLVLPYWLEPAAPVMRSADSDFAVRLAENDPLEAINFLLSTATPIRATASDWPDELALAIAHNPLLRLGTWARRYELAEATVSRGFRQVYGLSPSAYRLQIRGRMAWRKALVGRESLSQLSMETGFSDQAHMTRAVGLITGRTPGSWRRQGSIGTGQIDSRLANCAMPSSGHEATSRS
jgi:AraC-like DNA-binding protein